MGNLRRIKTLASGISAAKNMVKGVFGAEKKSHSVLSKGKRKLLLLTLPGIINVFALLLLVVILVGGVYRLTESIRSFFSKKDVVYTEEQIALAVNDAGALLQVMEQDPSVFQEGLLLIDKDAVMRILERVAEYNAEVTKVESVNYEYRVEQGLLKDLPDMDAFGRLSEKTAEGEEAASGSGSTESVTADFDYTVFYPEISISTSRDSIDYAGRTMEKNVFYMRWQPIVTLCSLYVQANYNNWGSYNDAWENQKKGSITDSTLENEWEEANYYLDDSQIDEVIDLYAYTYEYISDYTHDTWRNLWGLLNDKISFPDFYRGKSAYKINIPDISSDDETGVVTRITQYVPVIAPKSIRNSYIDYTYHYTTLENGDQMLTQRTITISPVTLVERMKELVPHFTENLFLENLKLLPASEDLITYYKEIIFRKAAVGELINESTSDVGVCSVIGAIVSKKDTTVSGGNGVINGVEGNGYIYLYPSDGWNGNDVYLRPASWIAVENTDYGLYEITGAALTSLTTPDNVSKEQIISFLKNYPFDSDGKTRKNCPLLASEQAMNDLADCLIKFQTSSGASISGMFGILVQEGGLRSTTLGKENWNFFSYTAGSSWEYGTVSYNGHSFRNYRDKYEQVESLYETAAVAAFEEQIYLVYENYWAKDQDTYYKMVWNKTDTADRNSVYAGITHSYCPPWQDKSMPYSKESHTGTSYYWKNATNANIGWINRCGQERLKVWEYMLSQ